MRLDVVRSHCMEFTTGAHYNWHSCCHHLSVSYGNRLRKSKFSHSWTTHNILCKIENFSIFQFFNCCEYIYISPYRSAPTRLYAEPDVRTKKKIIFAQKFVKWQMSPNKEENNFIYTLYIYIFFYIYIFIYIVYLLFFICTSKMHKVFLWPNFTKCLRRPNKEENNFSELALQIDIHRRGLFSELALQIDIHGRGLFSELALLGSALKYSQVPKAPEQRRK